MPDKKKVKKAPEKVVKKVKLNTDTIKKLKDSDLEAAAGGMVEAVALGDTNNDRCWSNYSCNPGTYGCP